MRGEEVLKLLSLSGHEGPPAERRVADRCLCLFPLSAPEPAGAAKTLRALLVIEFFQAKGHGLEARPPVKGSAEYNSRNGGQQLFTCSAEC